MRNTNAIVYVACMVLNIQLYIHWKVVCGWGSMSKCIFSADFDDFLLIWLFLQSK